MHFAYRFRWMHAAIDLVHKNYWAGNGLQLMIPQQPEEVWCRKCTRVSVMSISIQAFPVAMAG